jgi:regulator of sigma E protease
MLLSVVAAVAIFAILVVVHETGHFLVAKRLGVRVLRFSIGYPPRLFGVRRGETDYALGAVPFGGYVRMLGDEMAEEPSKETVISYLREIALDLISAAKSKGWVADHIRENTTHTNGPVDEGDEVLAALAKEFAEPPPGLAGAEAPAQANSTQVPAILGRRLTTTEERLLERINLCESVQQAIDSLADERPAVLLKGFRDRAFPSQRLATRFAIVLAGPLANMVFAPLLMILIFMVGVPSLLPVIGKVRQDMPAYQAGLREGDRVTGVNGKKITSWDDLSDAVKSSNGATLQLVLTRPGEQGATRLTMTPKRIPEETIYGNQAPTWVIGVSPRGDKTTLSYGPFAAIRAGTVQTAQLFATLCVGIAKIFEGATPVREALGGPIMIAQMAGRQAHQGLADLGLFTVMLSLELGIINLLPVPLLDGGHLLFFAVEGIRGEPMRLRHREIAMQVGLFLLVVLMAFVILNDISRLIG